jgi:DNA-binding IclR family transcriptional regulator
MREMLAAYGSDVLLLCRLFRDKVLCVHQERSGFALDISYSRGRPMPLFRGATSKIMLAYLPERQAARLFLEHRREIATAGLGEEWPEFSASLRALRRNGYCVSHGDVDKGAVGVGAPIFDRDRRLLGSLSRVMAEPDFSEARLPEIAGSVLEGARRITENLARLLRDDEDGARPPALVDAAE